LALWAAWASGLPGLDVLSARLRITRGRAFFFRPPVLFMALGLLEVLYVPELRGLRPAL